MQTVLEEVGEVLYYIGSWFIAFRVSSEFYLMIMQDFFVPKTSYFKFNLYILPAIQSQNIENSAFRFVFFRLFFKQMGAWSYCQDDHAHSNSI